jgi:ubiquinone/menaquinone biosynthesis C-methylase UbiE
MIVLTSRRRAPVSNVAKKRIGSEMREALDTQKLKSIYDRVSNHYDFQHAFLTARSDQHGRKLVVEKAVATGDTVLDCGAGTGSTALLAAERVGPAGKVTLLDVSEGMLAIAKEKAGVAGVSRRLTFEIGDMFDLPYDDASFDAVVSTYSVCPLRDPDLGALEMYRVAKNGGRIGIAHSAEPRGALTRWFAEKVESLAWRFPSVSLGCRPVSVLPALQRVGGKVLFQRLIGHPLWPFLVLVVEKRAV